MKQRIEVQAVTPSTGYKIKIVSVHQIDNQLVVISKISEPRGLAGDAICTVDAAVVVNTDAKELMPVVNYLTNIPKSEGNKHIGNYGRDYGLMNGKTTDFRPITDVSEIKELLDKGKCLYAPRTDGMTALRLGRFERKHTSTQPTIYDLSAEETIFLFTNKEIQQILNVYPIIDDGAIKIVFETIGHPDKINQYKDIHNLFSDANDHLEQTFYMTKDDEFYFDCNMAGVNTKLVTNAVEFTIPGNDPKLVLDFMLLVDKVIEGAKAPDSEYYKPYTLIQLNNKSILSCFEDLFISVLPDDEQGRGKIRTIENDMLVSMHEFLNAPNIIRQPASMGVFLLDFILSCRNLPEYKELHHFLFTFYIPIGFDLMKNPDKYLEQMLGVNVDRLYGTETSLEEKLAITEELEHSLLNEKTFDDFKFFIADFNKRAIEELIKPSYGQTAPDGGQYRTSYTEFDVLRHARFCIREDGHMSINLKDNSGYQRHYASGRRLHGMCENEFRSLAKVLGLEFADNTDFHKEMIFTPESTRKLKALGVHIHESSLRQQMAKLQQSRSNDSALRFFAPGVIKPEPQPVPQVLQAIRM